MRFKFVFVTAALASAVMLGPPASAADQVFAKLATALPAAELNTGPSALEMTAAKPKVAELNTGPSALEMTAAA